MADPPFCYPPFCYPAATGFTLNMVHMQTPPLIWKLVRRKELSSLGALKMDWETMSACTKDDNRSGMSVEDRKFIDIMNSPGMNLVAGRCPYLSVRNLTGFPTTKKMQSNA